MDAMKFYTDLSGMATFSILITHRKAVFIFQVVLTGEHNNESDSSWLKSTVGGCYFSLTSEYLILFKLNTPAFADSETDMQRGYIAKYDLDGSNLRFSHGSLLTKLSQMVVLLRIRRIYIISTILYKKMEIVLLSH